MMASHSYRQQKVALMRFPTLSFALESLLSRQHLILSATRKGAFRTLNSRTFYKRSRGSHKAQSSTDESCLTEQAEWSISRLGSTMILSKTGSRTIQPRPMLPLKHSDSQVSPSQ